jgi:Flp pilus assembly protein TadB
MITYSEEYKKFIEESYLKRKLSFYERFCKIFSFIKLPVPRKTYEELKTEVKFLHFRVTPEEIFSSTILSSILILLITFLAFFLHLIDTSLFFSLLLFGMVVFYFLFRYPRYLSFYYRTRATSEMLQTVLYMAISLQVVPNLEVAIKYAAENLSGPLGLDFKSGIWGLFSGKKLSGAEVLDDIAEKWKIESSEFSDALALLRASIMTVEDKEKNIRQAIEIMIEGTKARMETYAHKMKFPLSLISTFGITLPLFGLVLFPIFFLFIPELASPLSLAIIYDVVLFFIVYTLIFQNLFRRPYSYHQPNIVETEQITKLRKNILIASLLVGIFSLAIFSFLFFSQKILIFSEKQFLSSMGMIFSLALPFIIYNIFLVLKTSQLNKDVLKIEEELPTTLSIISYFLKLGYPIEKAINSSIEKMEKMESKNFFQAVNNKIALGSTLQNALFGEGGVLQKYPSRMLKMVMGLIVDISQASSYYLSNTLENISKYLRDALALDLKTKDILSQISYDTQMHSLVVAPLTAGIVVGLTVFTVSLFVYFGGSIQEMQEVFSTYGPIGSTFQQGFFLLINFSNLIPAPFFQLIVGVYLLELTYLLSYLYNEITYGDDEISKKNYVFKTFLVVFVFYFIVISSIYFGIKSLINLEEIAKMV